MFDRIGHAMSVLIQREAGVGFSASRQQRKNFDDLQRCITFHRQNTFTLLAQEQAQWFASGHSADCDPGFDLFIPQYQLGQLSFGDQVGGYVWGDFVAQSYFHGLISWSQRTRTDAVSTLDRNIDGFADYVKSSWHTVRTDLDAQAMMHPVIHPQQWQTLFEAHERLSETWESFVAGKAFDLIRSA